MADSVTPQAVAEEAGPQPSHLPFPVVGIGASAGGLMALQRLLSQMPARSGMAFVIILHLSPRHESNAAEILQRNTAMAVMQVNESVQIEADHVYVISPTHDLTMDDGWLRLVPSQRPRSGVHVAVDLFFRTLAQVHGARSICVVLSGTGSDGAVGLTHVKEAGGVTLAQMPEDADYDGMPRAAIATGRVDIVLPVDEMAQRLLDLWRNMREIRMPADLAEQLGVESEQSADATQRAEAALGDIMTLVCLATRHDFKHYKRATILRRIERRLQVNALPDLAAYRDYLKQNPDETKLLLQDLLISVTNFFRDREAFEALEREVVPALFQNRRRDEPVRVWVAGCATGEEAYSVAMLLHERAERTADAPDFQVFATEIDERAVTLARAGRYSSAIVADVPTADEAARQTIAQLEQEIRQIKEHLQGTIEHAETSTEELKASNEELQAINEELRSATEELETSKEELQSTNEELTTVNYELKAKVEETSLINDDLQNFIASTDIATVFIDKGLQIKRFTPQASTVFNLIPSDLGRSLLDITTKLDYPELADDARRTFAELRSFERSVRAHNGRHFLVRFLPYRTADDKISGAVLTFVDVSALRVAEQRMRLSEERLRTAAEATKDFAIITSDKAGLITAWNAGAVRLFQWRDDEAIGQPLALIYTEEERAHDLPEQELRRAARDGRIESARWQLRKDGTSVYCGSVTAPLGGEPDEGFSIIARDMTEQKQLALAQELVLAQEQAVRQQAQAASSLKDEFLAVMSHELKHPLNLIHTNAELLTRSPESRAVPTVLRAAQAIQRAACSQAKIIDDLLDLSRMRTGKLALHLEAISLDEVADAIVQAAAQEAGDRRVALNLQVDGRPLPVEGDRVRLEQIIWNLLSNALKFTPEGGRVDVTLGIVDAHVRLTVADTGRGIDPRFLSRIFEMFIQESRSPASERGLGIGLALTRELVQAHGGQISAHSDGASRGARFEVLLPLHRAVAPTLQAGGGDSAEPLAGLRVLVVDDSQETLSTFGELLSLSGAQVATAASGRQALEVLRRQSFDLLISDLGMPQMSGYDLMAAIRRVPAWAPMMAIALSGYGRDADAQKAQDSGFDAHLTKPTEFDALIRTVQALKLRRGTARQAGDTPRGDATADSVPR
ncbi:chemotaxis protein CheB [Aquabacterium sp.]|uniref:chemotaxis protein CheB n=1 Tax=Aquabacterium sp. TaxID=1872578 RepID=UPI002BB93C75|nr:chemotaxis protein CheB [Aquabacterium sp.]HSW04297.1 chemotaxis protein CheB [Aquabacterium sp.]